MNSHFSICSKKNEKKSRYIFFLGTPFRSSQAHYTPSSFIDLDQVLPRRAAPMQPIQPFNAYIIIYQRHPMPLVADAINQLPCHSEIRILLSITMMNFLCMHVGMWTRWYDNTRLHYIRHIHIISIYRYVFVIWCELLFFFIFCFISMLGNLHIHHIRICWCWLVVCNMQCIMIKWDDKETLSKREREGDLKRQTYFPKNDDYHHYIYYYYCMH